MDRNDTGAETMNINDELKRQEYRWINPDDGKTYTTHSFIDLLELLKKHGYTNGKYRFYQDGVFQYSDYVE